MLYPNSLGKITREFVKFSSGNAVFIPKAMPVFKNWRGAAPQDTYGNKPILDMDGVPGFAEQAILQIFINDGWHGAWIDSYRRKKRSLIGEYIDLPSPQNELFQKIYQVAGKKAGCFDVFCWKEQSVLFAEAKRKGRDRIRHSQLRWLSAAQEIGLPIEAFLIVEWRYA